MKLEEKLKNKYLYSKNYNIPKLFYFFFQYLKYRLKPRRLNSNWGVDLIVKDIFKNKKNGIYVDVGCHHPLINNNTNLLNLMGWKGINIDLDFNSIDMFNYFRPKDHNIKIALSDKKGFSNLYFFHNRAAKNTISKEFGENAKQIKKIKTDTLDNILFQNQLCEKKIDFLSIDVEGNELNVLKGFNLKRYQPKVILLELIYNDVKEFYQKDINSIIKSDIYKYMIENKYKLINWNHDDLMFMLNE